MDFITMFFLWKIHKYVIHLITHMVRKICILGYLAKLSLKWILSGMNKI